MVFVVRAVACERLGAVVPKVSNCANMLMEVGGISKAAIMNEDISGKSFDDEDEVQIHLDEAENELESRDIRRYRNAKEVQLGGESDDSEAGRAMLCDGQAEKR